jgi:hypothetical protein
VRALSIAHPAGQQPNVIATAIARELSAFIWAINREVIAGRYGAASTGGIGPICGAVLSLGFGGGFAVDQVVALDDMQRLAVRGAKRINCRERRDLGLGVRPNSYGGRGAGVFERLQADGCAPRKPKNLHGAWTFYLTAPGGFLVEVVHQYGVHKASLESDNAQGAP